MSCPTYGYTLFAPYLSVFIGAEAGYVFKILNAERLFEDPVIEYFRIHLWRKYYEMSSVPPTNWVFICVKWSSKCSLLVLIYFSFTHHPLSVSHSNARTNENAIDLKYFMPYTPPNLLVCNINLINVMSTTTFSR